MPAGASAGDGVTVARFSLTIDGVEIASFSELVGITSEADDASGPLLRKFPGKRQPPTVTLRRLLTVDTQLAAWHQLAVEGPAGTARKSAELIMYDTGGEPVARYHLERAWPSKLEIGALAARPVGALYETVTLSCERTQRVTA